MQQWEFKYVVLVWKEKMLGKGQWVLSFDGEEVKGDDVWKSVNFMGKKGWELIGVTPLISSAGGNAYTSGQGLWFKRPLSTDVD